MKMATQLACIFFYVAGSLFCTFAQHDAEEACQLTTEVLVASLLGFLYAAYVFGLQSNVARTVAL